jgi:hypothetical protein
MPCTQLIHTTMNNGRSCVLAKEHIDEMVVRALHPLVDGCLLNGRLGLVYQRVCNPLLECAVWSIVDSVVGKALIMAMQCCAAASSDQAWRAVEVVWKVETDRNPGLYEDGWTAAAAPAQAPWVAVFRWPPSKDVPGLSPGLLEQLERHIAWAVMEDEAAMPPVES